MRPTRKEPAVELLEAMKGPIPVDLRDGAETRRRAAIGRTASALRGEKRRRARIRTWSFAGVAAALLVAGGLGLLGYHARAKELGAASSVASIDGTAELLVQRGAVTVRKGSAEATIAVGAVTSVAEGDAILTREGTNATLTLPRGVHVDLGEKTATRVETARLDEQRVRLSLGSTSVSVPKPGGPKTFSVVTPDARVVVHGTIFGVVVEDDPIDHRLRTLVSVTRGSVFVESEAGERLLQAGESWSSRPAASVAAPENGGGAAAASAEPVSPSASPGAPRPRASIRHEALGAQNSLFQAALDARKTGDDAAVVSSLGELLRRYPDTPLAQEAELARFRALRRLHRDQEAAAEARRYLSSHPETTARDEARRALLEAAPASEK